MLTIGDAGTAPVPVPVGAKTPVGQFTHDPAKLAWFAVGTAFNVYLVTRKSTIAKVIGWVRLGSTALGIQRTLAAREG